MGKVDTYTAFFQLGKPFKLAAVIGRDRLEDFTELVAVLLTEHFHGGHDSICVLPGDLDRDVIVALLFHEGQNNGFSAAAVPDDRVDLPVTAFRAK